MNKVRAFIGLKVVSFGIWVYEKQPWGLLDQEDKNNLKILWDYYDKFESVLKGKM